MSYRKITVDGKQYEYVVGRTHLKIKGLKTVKTSTVGTNIPGTDNYIVTPAMVAAAIKNEPPPPSDYCVRHKHLATTLVPDPYAAELNQEDDLMWNCPKCVNERAGDI